MTRQSQAKINLFLDVLGKRDDGYHEVFTWMHTIDLADTISVKRINNEYCILKSDDTSIPFGKRNLCIKAFDAVKEKREETGNVEIALDKNIPLGSGLAGGSSNAASIIIALNQLFDLRMDDPTMMEISAGIGSDVPLFIKGGNALAVGRGTEIHPLPPFPAPIWLVLAKPEVPISTGEAYKWIKESYGQGKLDKKELGKHIEKGDLQFVCDNLYNAFQPVAEEKFPVIGEVRKRLIDEGCEAAQITGSGSAVFGLCRDEQTAKKIAGAIKGWEKVSFTRACRTK